MWGRGGRFRRDSLPLYFSSLILASTTYQYYTLVIKTGSDYVGERRAIQTKYVGKGRGGPCFEEYFLVMVK